MKKILVVDDDAYIANILEEVLVKEGYEVLHAYSGTEAVLIYEQKRPDLVLLDLMLPGLGGEEVLMRMKGTPVIVVSAKVQIDSKVDLLMGGAVDYITKPFDTKELLARIVVQLRQKEYWTETGFWEAGDLRIDALSLNVMVKENPVKLTRTEYAILKLLMINPKQVIAKSVLLDRISADTPDCTERSLKQHISNLRKKLQDAGGEDYIETVWGIGFKLKQS